jgi:hypothetical protein
VGNEFINVLEGVLQLWIGETICEIYPRDSTYFKSTSLDRLGNSTNQPVMASAIIAPPISSTSA